MEHGNRVTPANTDERFCGREAKFKQECPGMTLQEHYWSNHLAVYSCQNQHILQLGSYFFAVLTCLYFWRHSSGAGGADIYNGIDHVSDRVTPDLTVLRELA